MNRWITTHRHTARPSASLTRSAGVSCTDQRVSLWGVLTRTVIATSALMNSARRMMANIRRLTGILVLASPSIGKLLRLLCCHFATQLPDTARHRLTQGAAQGASLSPKLLTNCYPMAWGVPATTDFQNRCSTPELTPQFNGLGGLRSLFAALLLPLGSAGAPVGHRQRGRRRSSCIPGIT